MKKVTQTLAAKIAARTNKDYPLIINRIRTQIVSTMMKHNAIMIESSIEI